MEGRIYEAISNVMADIGAVGKNNTNNFDKYKFRGIDDVMNALYPAMVKNHVFVTPEVLESLREERVSKEGKSNMMYSVLKIKYTFYTDDGSSVSCVVIGEAMDRSDKSTNKAMSAGFKYACFQTFCIPTEEMQDADAESPELGTKVDSNTRESKKEEKSYEKETHSEPVRQESISEPSSYIPEKSSLINTAQIHQISDELKRTGVTLKQVLAIGKVDSLEKMSQTTAVAIINKLARTKSKS